MRWSRHGQTASQEVAREGWARVHGRGKVATAWLVVMSTVTELAGLGEGDGGGGNGLGFACLGLGNPRIACDGFVIN